MQTSFLAKTLCSFVKAYLHFIIHGIMKAYINRVLHVVEVDILS